MSGQTQARKNNVLQIHIVSGLSKQTAKSLVVGNTLKPLTPSYCETVMAEKKNSGKVKVKWMKHITNAEMGNPHAACKLQVQRQRLNGDWWDCRILLKVQSSLQGNLQEYTDGRPCMLCSCKKVTNNHSS